MVSLPRLRSHWQSRRWQPTNRSFFLGGKAAPAPSDESVTLKTRLETPLDYVGPPCPRSNLRPVKYSAPFTPMSTRDRLPTFSSRSTAASPHPYSLQEFTADAVRLPDKLAELRDRLEVEDLEWTLFRKRIDKLNQSFWEKQSARFEELEAAERRRVLSSETSEDPRQGQERLDIALDAFYQRWLVEQKSVFMRYNLQWWRAQADLMKGGWKAQMRMWRWKIACWIY